MAKHLTVLVHGIGEQVAGETVDEFVGAARHELNLDKTIVDNSVVLAETEKALSDDEIAAEQLHQFPCHIRRLTKEKDEMVFAEVHWSDLSKAPIGVFATVFDLLRLILGMGYLALDNIENNQGPLWWVVRYATHIFVWVFFLILAPINALVFIGALGLLLDTAGIGIGYGEGQWRPMYLLAFMGVILTVASGWTARKADTYLKRLFFYGLFGLGMFCLIAVLSGLNGSTWHPNDNWLPTCDVRQSFVVGVPPGMNCFTGVLIFCLNSIWLFEIGLFLFIAFFSMFSRKILTFNKDSIYLSICAGMLLFWMTFLVAFWAVFRTTVARLAGPDEMILLTRVMNEHFDEATATLPFVVAAVILVLIVAALVGIVRVFDKMLFGIFRAESLKIGPGASDLKMYLCTILSTLLVSSVAVSYALFRVGREWWGNINTTLVLSGEWDDATLFSIGVVLAVVLIFLMAGIFRLLVMIGKAKKQRFRNEGLETEFRFSRLILNPSLNIAFVLASMVLVLGAFYAFANWWLVDGRTDKDIIIQNANRFVWVFGNFADALIERAGAASTIVAGIGVLVIRNSGFVAAALGVGRDIVVYATRSHGDSPFRSSIIRKMRLRAFGRKARPSRYIFRERIEARFEETMRRLIAQEGPVDSINIVSHSQGTVVAAMGLLKLKKSGGAAFADVEDKIKLVTMGCPLQHVYRKYFYKNYHIGEAAWHSKERWLNIFRVDDFVGKSVSKDGLKATDEPVLAAKGHSHYWSDKLVWKILIKHCYYKKRPA